MKTFSQFLLEKRYGHTLWIDPKGKVYDMNDRKEITSDSGHAFTHYDWVADNFTKYFGNKAPDNMGKVVYDAPHEKGWARIRNGNVSLNVEVDIKKLSRAQKKAIRDIYDSHGDLTRHFYVDIYKKNKTSRSGDIGLNDYESIVDFLSEEKDHGD